MAEFHGNEGGVSEPTELKPLAISYEPLHVVGVGLGRSQLLEQLPVYQYQDGSIRISESTSGSKVIEVPRNGNAPESGAYEECSAKEMWAHIPEIGELNSIFYSFCNGRHLRGRM